jgi:hypothetical protein
MPLVAHFCDTPFRKAQKSDVQLVEIVFADIPILEKTYFVRLDMPLFLFGAGRQRKRNTEDFRARLEFSCRVSPVLRRHARPPVREIGAFVSDPAADSSR